MVSANRSKSSTYSCLPISSNHLVFVSSADFKFCSVFSSSLFSRSLFSSSLFSRSVDCLAMSQWTSVCTHSHTDYGLSSTVRIVEYAVKGNPARPCVHYAMVPKEAVGSPNVTRLRELAKDHPTACFLTVCIDFRGIYHAWLEFNITEDLVNISISEYKNYLHIRLLSFFK